MAKYDISKETTEDLYRIWDYTADTWSEEQADIYYGILEAAMDAVGSAPATNGRPPHVRQRSFRAGTFRQSAFGLH